MARSKVKKGCLAIALLLVALVALLFAMFWYQGQQDPEGRPEYVALGSSFAAGAGLGKLQPDSPLLCARSMNGYPQQLARMRRLEIVDMSCGGATTRNLLHGGQFFQGPQIRVITPETRLVTISVGGNDIGYVGDLSMLAARHTDSLFGRMADLFWPGPRQPSARNYREFEGVLLATVRAIQRMAPRAKIVLVSYPAILPPAGTCAEIGLTEAEAEMMRRVAEQLAVITRSVASRTGVLLVDMHRIGRDHDACSASPWTSGWANGSIAPLHPTLAGAKATAAMVAASLD